MSDDWEEVFNRWSKPPGQTELDRCNNAVRAVRDAIQANPVLSTLSINVFAQGSYHNRVNVRQDSDVDIGVCFNDDVFFYYLPVGFSPENFGIKTTPVTYEAFKNEVEKALTTRFGDGSIHRGNKAFDIKNNTYRVEADVAAFFPFRSYLPDGRWYSGVELRPDNAPQVRVVNWPKQHYANAVYKNNATSRSYKGTVRILKSLRNKMDEEGISEARPIPGFLIECLVYRVPNEHLVKETWTDSVRESLNYLIGNTCYGFTCSEWKEVNDFKYLFHPTQKWTSLAAYNFLFTARKYVGLDR